MQISTKDMKCCKCKGKLSEDGADGFHNRDKFKCEKCGQKYHRYWTGDFWDYAK